MLASDQPVLLRIFDQVGVRLETELFHGSALLGRNGRDGPVDPLCDLRQRYARSEVPYHVQFFLRQRVCAALRDGMAAT